MLKSTLLAALLCATAIALLPHKTQAQPVREVRLQQDGQGHAATATAPACGRPGGASARQGRVKFYVKIKPQNFSCVWGGYMAVRLQKKWVAQITGPGRFLVGTVPAGRRIKFYAEDAAHQNFWGPWKLYMKPGWTWYVLSLNCK